MITCRDGSLLPRLVKTWVPRIAQNSNVCWWSVFSWTPYSWWPFMFWWHCLPPVRWGLLDFMSEVPPPSFSSAGPQLQALDRRVPRRTRTASSGSEWPPPDPNGKLRIRVIPLGHQLQALDRSVPCRNRTATSGAERSPLDLNCKQAPLSRL